MLFGFGLPVYLGYMHFFSCFMACMIYLSKFQLLGVFFVSFWGLWVCDCFLEPFTRLDAIP